MKNGKAILALLMFKREFAHAGATGNCTNKPGYARVVCPTTFTCTNTYECPTQTTQSTCAAFDTGPHKLQSDVSWHIPAEYWGMQPYLEYTEPSCAALCAADSRCSHFYIEPTFANLCLLLGSEAPNLTSPKW